MYAYIARQPIYDANKTLYGYELLFRDGETNSFPNIDGDEATSRLITEHHLLVGVETITAGTLAFINFSAETLIHHFPTSIQASSTVIEVLETVPISDELLLACKGLHEQGYQLALDDHDFDPKWDVFLPYTTYIKVDIQQFNMLQISKYIQRIQPYAITLLAERVETAEQFEQLKLLGFSLFQGYLFAKPEMLKHKQLNSNQLTLVELIAEAAATELDFDKLNALVERDLALSYKLLRFINNSAFAKQQPIESLKLAMTYMGETELRKFLALFALSNLTDGKKDVLLMQSLVRAKCCEQLSLTNNPPLAFMTGLFSMVDSLLSMPMQQVLKQLPLPPSITEALLHDRGPLGRYLKMIIAYEETDWSLVDNLAEKMTTQPDMAKIYQTAVAWAQEIL